MAGDDAPLNPDAYDADWIKKVRRQGPFVVRRFEGDNRYSWAVFRRVDLPGDVCWGGTNAQPVFYGEARPIVTGLSRREARAERDRLQEAVNGVN